MAGTVDILAIETNLSNLTHTPGTTTQALQASTKTLLISDTSVQIFTGATASQIVRLPNCTTMLPAQIGWAQIIINDGTASIAVQDNAGGALITVLPGQRLIARCTGIGSAAGTWSLTTESASQLKFKAGTVAAGSFAGSPKKATVTFSAAFANTSYSAVVTGSDGRFWTIESIAVGSFVINTNANLAPTGSVYWHATANGEN